MRRLGIGASSIWYSFKKIIAVSWRLRCHQFHLLIFTFLSLPLLAKDSLPWPFFGPTHKKPGAWQWFAFHIHLDVTLCSESGSEVTVFKTGVQWFRVSGGVCLCPPVRSDIPQSPSTGHYPFFSWRHRKDIMISFPGIILFVGVLSVPFKNLVGSS